MDAEQPEREIQVEGSLENGAVETYGNRLSTVTRESQGVGEQVRLEENIEEAPYHPQQRTRENSRFFEEAIPEDGMDVSWSEQSRSRSPEHRNDQGYGRAFPILREPRESQLMSIIADLQNNQRQLQEQIVSMANRSIHENVPIQPSIGYLDQLTPADNEEALARHLLVESYPTGWRAPKMTSYDGTTDPEDHVHSFRMEMEDTTGRRDIWCRMFRRTLKGEAVGWYRNLPVGSINSFKDLEKSFKIAFGHKIRRKGLNTTLLTVVQGERESTREYMDRFAMAVQKVICSEEGILMALVNGLRPTRFSGDLVRDLPSTFAEAMERSYKESNVEDYHEAKYKQIRQRPKGQYDQDAQQKQPRREARSQNREVLEDKARRAPFPRENFINYGPQRVTPFPNQRQVFLALRGERILPEPRPMRTETAVNRNPHLYCEYHEDIGHTTAECWILAKELERVQERQGSLPVRQRLPSPPRRTAPAPAGHEDHREIRTSGYQNRREDQDGRNIREILTISGEYQDGRNIGEILTISGGEYQDGRNIREILAISGGEAARGGTGFEGKRYAEDLSRTDGVIKKIKAGEDIRFSNEDLTGITVPHHDPLVITPIVQREDKERIRLNRVLVDTGASVDVLYWSAFDQLGFSRADLGPCGTPITGFGQGEVQMLGTIDIPITLGKFAQETTMIVKFSVVPFSSGYNAILGRIALHAFGAVTSSLHQCLKFPSEAGICTVKGSQKKARECYINSTGQVMTAAEEKNKLPHTVKEERPKFKTASDMVAVELNGGKVQVGADLPQEVKNDIVKLLKENEDLFAKDVTELKGIDRSLTEHKLAVGKHVRPVRQKMRPLRGDRKEAAAEEVQKLIDANFIRPVKYPEWLSNVVMVRKADGGWRMCVDFTNVNKVCPKDSYPLPSVDHLVDQASGCKLLSFMDAHSGYNQIPMAREDEEKTSFISETGTFCFRVMPFGLRNAGATFQRAMDQIFKDQIGRNLEVYVDDILVCSKTVAEHLPDLRETFDNIRRAGLRLKAKKCSFGVTEGHFLGFKITPHGIKARTEKIEAIMAMTPPKTIKEVQKLNGKVNALSRFLARGADTLQPLFKLIKSASPKITWTEECEEAFQKLKEQLKNLPTLQPPFPGEPLKLYIAASDNATSTVLMTERDGTQRPIYYYSRTLQGAEKKYPQIEKLGLAIVTTARRLKPYFQAHPITIPTEFPLLQLLHKPDVSGRLTKWAVELSEFYISIVPAKAIKGQAVADFLAEFTPSREEVESWWIIHVDGSAGNSGCGAGIIIQTPTKEKIEHAINFNFKTTNNEAEYEALIAGAQLGKALGARRAKFHTDSRLVANQVNGEFMSNEEGMCRYTETARDTLQHFAEWELHHISRTENKEADILARLGASPGVPKGRWVRVEHQEMPSIAKSERNKILTLAVKEDWRVPIKNYITKGIVPTDAMEERKLRNKAAWFTTVGNDLFRRAVEDSIPLRICVTQEEGKEILTSAHKGACGPHQGVKMLEKQVVRQGYYWPQIRKDAEELVRSCNECQRHANIQRRPSSIMNPVVTPVPFARWGLDIVGPFPVASRGRKFLFVAVDYFTKWAEAEPTNAISEQNVIQFIFRNIICRFGVPLQIITDNGTQFTGKKVKKFCEDSGIKMSFAPVYHPQANGQVEVTNRTITSILKRKVSDNPGTWADLVPETMWAYRTTVRTPTGHPPFTLAFGLDAVAPAEVVWPTARVTNFNPEDNNLAILLAREKCEELREMAAIRDLTYKRKAARYHNQRVNEKKINSGDLVLRNGRITGLDQNKGKLSPKWEGPYVVVEEVRPGIYRLAFEDGQKIERTWHSDNLSKYFQ